VAWHCCCAPVTAEYLSLMNLNVCFMWLYLRSQSPDHVYRCFFADITGVNVNVRSLFWIEALLGNCMHGQHECVVRRLICMTGDMQMSSQTYWVVHVDKTTFLLVLQCVHVVIISVFLRRVFVILSIDVIVLYSSWRPAIWIFMHELYLSICTPTLLMLLILLLFYMHRYIYM
jgi:hypothetical protein